MEKNKLGFYMGSTEKNAYTTIHDNPIQLMVGFFFIDVCVFVFEKVEPVYWVEPFSIINSYEVHFQYAQIRILS